jgi:hypothetical protein
MSLEMIIYRKINPCISSDQLDKVKQAGRANTLGSVLKNYAGIKFDTGNSFKSVLKRSTTVFSKSHLTLT